MKKIISLLTILSIILTVTVFNNTSVLAKCEDTPNITASAQRKLDSVVNEWLSNISPNMTDYEKALSAYFMLVSNCGYRTRTQMSGTAYGAIVDGWARCEGYANAYSYLLDKLNISNRVVVGGNPLHAWNLVKIDGKWYHCSPTSDVSLKGFLLGEKSMIPYFSKNYPSYFKYNGKWKISDGRSKVKVENEDYSENLLHKQINEACEKTYPGTDIKNFITILNGYIYYKNGNLVKIQGGQTTVVDDSCYVKASNGIVTWEERVIPGKYFIHCCKNKFWYCSSGFISSFNFITGEVDLNDSYESQLNFKNQLNALKFSADIAPTCSRYGTKGRTICSICGKVINHGTSVNPLKIKSKPTLKVSSKSKGKLVYKLTNKYYNEKSPILGESNYGGYQIKYKKKGSKNWTTRTYFSSKKDISKTLKLKPKTKYYIKARYVTTIGSDGYYGRRNQYGPWSKVKTVKVK